MIKNWNEGIKAGGISLIIGVVITYIIHLITPSGDLSWALIAVAIASFCSGFFSSQYK